MEDHYRDEEPNEIQTLPQSDSRAKTCCLVMAVLLPTANVFLAFAAPYTVFPILAEDRAVSASIVGYIFAIWGAPNLLSFLYPSFQRCCGTKRLFLLSIFTLNLSFLLMAFCDYIQDRIFFIVWAFFTRMIQGIAAAFLKVMIYVVAKRLFPHRFEILSELISTTVILFNGVGPLYSAELESVTSFSIVIYVASGLGFFIVFIQSWLVLPKSRIESTQTKESKNPSHTLQRKGTLKLYKSKGGLTYCKLCKQPLFLIANLQCFVSVFCQVFFTPFLALKLKNGFNVEEDLHGYFFLARALGGIIGATPGVYLLRKCFRLSSIIALGAVLNLISYIVFSMSPHLGLPHNLALIWSGITLNGFAFSLLYSPILPYMNDYYSRHRLCPSEPVEVEQAQLLAKSIAVFNITIGVGETFGHFIGGLMYDGLGFQGAMEVASLFLALSVALWFIFGHFFDSEEYRYFKGRKRRQRKHVSQQSINPMKQDPKDDDE